MEFETQEDQKEIKASPNYNSVLEISNSTNEPKMPSNSDELILDAPLQMRKPKYKECLKNHAVGIGGHAVDGCGEFMPAGEDGTLDALKCAACNCHRNFHRKETQLHHLPYYGTPPCGYVQHVLPPQRPLALPSTSGGGAGGGYREDQEELCNPNNSVTKKRFRTRFNQEQKEKMLELAEKLGWRIQRQDEGVVQQLCNEICTKRHVFKVWMHNNKLTLGKKTLIQSTNP
ncbi:zinc-finger homeodomain protein 2-like isoform X1 [Nicotiana tabacum]|uniref:zinc-finger homeodomain protein 2-like isoform X1 n=1 Tax=Nicotiana tabacum TaxID=4097 RepID=UPI003F4E92B3